jgi:asparagine synthase (glutamine-hydrolysing)
LSAICGAIRTDGAPCPASILDGTVASLERLGGDGAGRWADRAGGCNVALAATLRHATPEDAADEQPATAADGSIVLTGDLRVDNRGELAAALPVDDRPSTPDSAFVIAAYEHWGEGFLDRLVGEFALAIVDRRRGGLLLARDHAGIRPLVIHERGGLVAFASNALALTAFEGIGHVLDRERAVEVLALAYPSERTFVKGVRWFSPGAAMWADASGTRRWKWWDPDPRAIRDLGSPAAHEAELREQLDTAVAARLRSTGAIGASVSGGLDSTSVAASAAVQLVDGSVRTYTSVPPQGWTGAPQPRWDADEADLVRLLAARHPALRPSFVRIPLDTSLFAGDQELWELGGGPPRNPCNSLWIRAVSRTAATDGVTTLLTGARGNMMFSADGPDWLRALVRAGRPVEAGRELLAWRRASGQSAIRTTLVQVHPALPARARRLIRSLRKQTTPLERWRRSSCLRPEIAATLDLAAHVPALRARPDQRAVAIWVTQAGAAQADGAAALAALNGVEHRDPTGDRRLVEAAIRQPEWVRRHDGITRAVARGSMSNRLPSEIVQRTRRGEQLPDWLDVMTARLPELHAELEELRAHELSRELIDVGRLEDFLARWPKREARANPAVVADYRLNLYRALSVSRYLRWFERRADRQGQDHG